MVTFNKQVDDAKRPDRSRTLIAIDSATLIALMLIGALMVIYAAEVLAGRPKLLSEVFDINAESTLPTWVSSVLWLVCAIALAGCSSVSEGPERFVWAALAIGALLFSIDEVAMLHERLFSALFEQVSSADPRSKWSVGAIPFVAVAVGALFVLQRHLGKSPVRWWVVAGFCVTAFGGWCLEASINLFPTGVPAWIWQIEEISEESLESVGCVLVARGALLTLRRRVRVSMSVGPRQ